MVDYQTSIPSRSVPPQNVEAEELILGGILFDPKAIGRIADILTAEVFYLKAHGEIYQAALSLHRQGKPTDILTVSAWLEDHHQLETVGGLGRLAQLLERTVSAANIDRYAVIILDKYLRRQLISAGNDIIDLGHDTATDLEDVFNESEKKIFNLTQKRPQEGLVPISEPLTSAFREIELLQQKILLPGIPSGFYDLDAYTSGFQRSDLIIIAGRPSMGKCLAANSEIVLDNGSLATIEEIYHHRQGRILTLQDNWKFVLTEPSDFIDDGVKPVFRLTTKLGRTIETTITHPFLTIQGWQNLSELKPGDKIAVPRQINVFGTETIPDYQIKLLAYLIGDGCLTNTSPQFTNSNLYLQKDFIQASTKFSEVKVLLETSQGTIKPTFYVTSDLDFMAIDPNQLTAYEITALSENNKNLVTLWLDKLGLWRGKSHERIIPSIIFRLNSKSIALFINRLFATDGWATVLKSGQSQISYATISEKLARQIQHLLLRFGIIATLKKRSIKYKENPEKAWQLDITDAKSMKIFIETIGILGKEKQLKKIQISLKNKKKQTNQDLIPREIWQDIEKIKGDETWESFGNQAGIKGYNNLHVGKRGLSRLRLFQLGLALDSLHLQHLANSEIYWDEIVTIEFIGHKQVYDLTIAKTHNFVANDICVHNTSFALNIAHNIAKNNNFVVIFSLEMSKEQLAMRLLASEAKLESNRLRGGRVSQEDMEKLVMALGMLSDLPVYIDDTANASVSQMRSQLRRLQSEKKAEIGLVLLDYLQLMEGSGSDNRVQELSRITRNLKGLAREVNAPVIALSQLSRAVEARTNKRPMMSDLRESGSIEQDADLILMLYRDEYYNPDSHDRGIAEVNIAKHRNGPTGIVKMLFQPEYTKFLNLQQSQSMY
jgi:replicative DNA helicase